MTTLTLPSHKSTPLLSFTPDSRCRDPHRPLLLVFTADEPFWRALLTAGLRAAHKLIRRQDITNTAYSLGLFKPGAVLFDLDPPSAWDAADSLLQNNGAPPILLLTSRGDQIDFKAAIEAGSLINKGGDPATVLALARLALEDSDLARHQHKAMQQSIVRQLKPCAWSAQATPLHRFWGINE